MWSLFGFKALQRCINPPPAIKQAGLLKWWGTVRGAVDTSPACDRSDVNLSCPACQAGDPCPRDVLFLAVAERVALGTHGEMDDTRVRELLHPGLKQPLNIWRKHHGDVLAYALWRIARYRLDHGRDGDAFTVVDQGIAMHLHLHLLDPRLAHLACERILETGDATKALAVANTLLGKRTTDPAYDDLDDWAMFTHNALYAQTPPPPKEISYPRRARPAGLVNPRRYT